MARISVRLLHRRTDRSHISIDQPCEQYAAETVQILSWTQATVSADVVETITTAGN